MITGRRRYPHMRCPLFFLFTLISFWAHAQYNQKLSIYFPSNEFGLSKKNKFKIDSIFKTDEILKVSIVANTDSIGSNDFNDDLALKRAIEVRIYLMEKGFSPEKISSKSNGKREPITDNNNEIDRALNRRVDLICDVKNPPKLPPPPKVANVEKSKVEKSKYEKTRDEKSKVAEVVPKQDKPLVERVKVDNSKVDSSKASPRRKVVIERPLNEAPKPKEVALKNPPKELHEAEVGEQVVIQNILFEGSRHVVMAESKTALGKLLKTLKDNPGMRIEIQGHICCQTTGDGLDEETGTYDLSIRRAKAIYDYLIGQGIDQARLTYRGFGSSHPLVNEEIGGNPMLNRRVEVKVLAK